MIPYQDKILSDRYCDSSETVQTLIDLVREHDAKLAAGEAWRSGGGGKCSVPAPAAEIEQLKKELAEARETVRSVDYALERAGANPPHGMLVPLYQRIDALAKERNEARAQLKKISAAVDAIPDATDDPLWVQIPRWIRERDEARRQLADAIPPGTVKLMSDEEAREQGRQEAREGIVMALFRRRFPDAARNIALAWKQEGGAS